MPRKPLSTYTLTARASSIGLLSAKLLAAFTIASLLGIPDSAHAAATPARVHVAQGELQGVSLDNGVSALLGVPYAAAPLGDLRWRPPAPVSAWFGTRNATLVAARCMQPAGNAEYGPWTHEYLSHEPMSEDCLYLNIWVPTHSARTRLPILFWIHGGGFTGGSGAVDIYNGEAFARDARAIVISVNYRLGVFAFFSHPELSSEGINGNQAGYDLIAALRWVQNNAHALGGDPGRVTIAGQSGGAAAVNALIVSPIAHGLFMGAIMQSFPVGVLPSSASLTAAQESGVSLARALNVSSLAELRTISAEQIEAKSGRKYGYPTCACFFADGKFLAEVPTLAIANRHQSDVPTMAGIVSAESPVPVSVASYANGVAGRYRGLSEDFLRIYPASTNEEAKAQELLSGRERLLVNMDRWVAARARTSKTPVFLYMFDHTPPHSSQYGAFHTSEVPYVFGTLDAAPERGFTAQDREISRNLMAYWANFVKSGDPNGRGLPRWPRATGLSPSPVMELGDRWEPLSPMPAIHRAFFYEYFNGGGYPFLF
jgi:para-nitrobenzyl esterase